MALWYVYHAAAGAGTGADWTNAYTTLAAACTAKAAGDTFFVADDHAETQASAMTITSPGTEATPCRVICVRRTGGTVPPVSADLRTTATISTTATSAMTLGGTVSECYGIIFNCSTGSSQANLTLATTAGRTWRFVNCALRVGNTSGSTRILTNAVWLENTTVQVANAGQGLQAGAAGRVIWRNTPSAITGATIPSNLFNTISQSNVFMEGVDISALTSAKNIMAHSANAGLMVLKNCKLSSTANVAPSGTSAWGGSELQIIDCDSGDVHYRNEKYNFAGTQTTETTIVLTGGATDGTTPISWKIVTTTDAEKEMPFEALPIYIWNDTTGSSKTVTLQGIWGGGAVPLNDDIWIEVYAKTTSGFPSVTKYTSGKADTLATGANCSTGTGTWGGSTTKFSMAVTFTPAEKGLITIYIKAGAVSSTFYVDPKPVVT